MSWEFIAVVGSCSWRDPSKIKQQKMKDEKEISSSDAVYHVPCFAA
jgi:hypothetical protein